MDAEEENSGSNDSSLSSAAGDTPLSQLASVVDTDTNAPVPRGRRRKAAKARGGKKKKKTAAVAAAAAAAPATTKGQGGKEKEPAPKPKRKKTDIRQFQQRWTDTYGFIEKDGRAQCVFCLETVVRRTYSVQRHFQTLHNKFFSSEEEKKGVIEHAILTLNAKEEPAQAAAAAATQDQPAKDLKDYATEASFTLSLCISEKGKPFTEGEFIKDTFLACAENLFEDFTNREQILSRIRDIPASARTMQRRMAEMASDVRNQQTANLANCEVFSVALEDTVDTSDIRRLTVFVRYVASGNIHEELCYQKVVEKPLSGADILDSFIQHFDQRGVTIAKIASVATDGSLSLSSKPGGFSYLLQEKVKHVIILSPTIIHQEELCNQISGGELKLVMDTVVKIVNLIASRAYADAHEKFQDLLSEVEKTHGELSARNNVRWLGSGKVLECFITSLEEIRAFFGEKWQTYPELWNDFWVLKLYFLTDLVGHLNDLNSRLQRKGQTIDVLYEQWKLFTSKLSVFRRDIQMGAFRYFQHVRRFATAKGNIDIPTLDGCMAALEQSFYLRFQELQQFGPLYPFIVRADEFIEVHVDPTFLSWLQADNLEMELLELRVSDLWCSKFREMRKSLENQDDKPGREAAIFECWNSLPDKFSSMKKMAVALLTVFGSTNCSAVTQSHLKNSFNPLRCRLSTENSETTVRLKLTNCKPNVKKLCTEITSQGSH